MDAITVPKPKNDQTKLLFAILLLLKKYLKLLRKKNQNKIGTFSLILSKKINLTFFFCFHWFSLNTKKFRDNTHGNNIEKLLKHTQETTNNNKHKIIIIDSGK